MNRFGNTVAVLPRLGGTGLTFGADLFNTLATVNKEVFEVIGDTSQKVKDVLLGAWTHKTTKFKKAINIAVSPIVAIGTGLTGATKAIFRPLLLDGAVNTRNTGKNFLYNTYGSLRSFLSKKPISDFSYKNMKTKPLKLGNRVSNLQFGKEKPE